jgi:hypothetical protein
MKHNYIVAKSFLLFSAIIQEFASWKIVANKMLLFHKIFFRECYIPNTFMFHFDLCWTRAIGT